MNKAQEQQWQAEDDARTMANNQEIISDKGRMNRAIKVAKAQAADLNKRAAAMNNVASFKNGGRMSLSSSLRGTSANSTSSRSTSGSRSKITGSRSTASRGRRK